MFGFPESIVVLRVIIHIILVEQFLGHFINKRTLRLADIAINLAVGTVGLSRQDRGILVLHFEDDFLKISS